MTDDLEPIVSLVSQRSGMALSTQQRERLRDAARQYLDITGPIGLARRLESSGGARLLLELMAVVTVHKTDLFRDAPQLEALERFVLTPMTQLNRPLEVWSAGCATGEEVATLLLLLNRVGASPRSRVLGTDLSPSAIERARQLRFSSEAMRRVPAELAARFFTAVEGGAALERSLSERARFDLHNLVDTPYPVGGVDGRFDLIVCRNVLIYFTPEAADEVVGRLAERLTDDGILVLSAAEPILRSRTDLETVRFEGAFFYRPRRKTPVPSMFALPAPRPSSPLPPPRPSQPTPRPSAPLPPRASAPTPRPSAPTDDPAADGERLFELVLQWSAEGQADTETEAGLRKALYLSPDLAAARYCLGLLLERRQLKTEAQTEYRRALSVLELGRARPTPFFLNLARLTEACRHALGRLGRT